MYATSRRVVEATAASVAAIPVYHKQSFGIPQGGVIASVGKLGMHALPGTVAYAPQPNTKEPAMETRPLQESFKDLLMEPNMAVIATVRKDGRPQCVPTWYEYSDGHLLLNMTTDRLRL